MGPLSQTSIWIKTWIGLLLVLSGSSFRTIATAAAHDNHFINHHERAQHEFVQHFHQHLHKLPNDESIDITQPPHTIRDVLDLALLVDQKHPTWFSWQYFFQKHLFNVKLSRTSPDDGAPISKKKLETILNIKLGAAFASNMYSIHATQFQIDRLASKFPQYIIWAAPVKASQKLPSHILSSLHSEDLVVYLLNRQATHNASSSPSPSPSPSTPVVSIQLILINAFDPSTNPDLSAILTYISALPECQVLVCHPTVASYRLIQIDLFPLSSTQQDLGMDLEPVGLASLQNLIATLAALPEVALLQPKPQFVLLNNYGAPNQQANTLGPMSTENTPVWSYLRGDNQVVGLADSNLDINNCFFRNGNDIESDSASQLDANGCNSSWRNVLCYFRTDPSVPYFDDGDGGHGTHVAGTFFGRYYTTSQASTATHAQLVADSATPNGMAPNVKVAFTATANAQGQLIIPSDLAVRPFFSDSYGVGARVHSNSWGCATANPRNCNFYSFTARSVDEFMWNNKNFLIVFAAGNDGDYVGSDASTDPGYIDGFYTVGSPATAKNIVAVGASETGRSAICYNDQTCNMQNMALFSSRGFTLDNRVKPDIVIQGDRVLSARSRLFYSQTCSSSSMNDQTVYKDGTSMATPGMSGAALLVRQYYLEYNPNTGQLFSGSPSGPLADGKGPSAALLKATLIASARGLTGTYNIQNIFSISSPININSSPDRVKLEGFGKINLNNVLKFPESDNIALQISDRFQIDNGETHQYKVNVSSGGSLKAVLTYTDFPGVAAFSGSTTRVLVNDISLAMRCVTSQGCPLADNEIVSASTLDNVQQIPLVGSAGYYDPITFNQQMELIITISAVDVPEGPQPYALVLSGELFSITEYPSEGAYVPTWGDQAITASPSSGDPCFPADALVQLESGLIKRMDQVQVGDRVHIGDNKFSEIFFFSHRLSGRFFDFVRLEVKSEREDEKMELFLTKNHYMPLYNKGNKLVAAGAVTLGDIVMLGSGKTAVVERISTVQKEGLYNPHTIEGSLVVNGVMTSCYTTSVVPWMAKVLLKPIYWMYQAKFASVFPGRFFDRDQPFLASIMPKGTQVY